MGKDGALKAAALYICLHFVAQVCSGTMSDKDQEEEQNITKKDAAILAIKRTPAYILVKLYTDDKQRPQTPDPFMKPSKRGWERSVQKWRSSLRARLFEIHVNWST
jgi:protein-disulfide isomerase